MKPIKLTFEGLHSFKTRQEIDFDKLCTAGLFGIFGPTGSGKSTILDGITLALFGEVVRASSGTQAIMNSQSNTLMVSFTFDLGLGTETQRYRAVRVFKRKKDSRDNIETNQCKLLLLTENGEIPLASDKKSEVDAKIGSLLSLTMQDFTRSVVLPQGAFAEFLQMANKDRRLMFERLFSLSQYGQNLDEKFRKDEVRLKEIKTSLEAKVIEVGSITKNELLSAEVTLAQKIEAKRKLDEKVTESSTKLANAQHLWDLVAQFEDTKAHHQMLQAKKPELEANINKLRFANKAAIVWPAIAASRAAQQQQQQSALSLKQAQLALRSAEMMESKLNVEFELLERTSQPRLDELAGQKGALSALCATAEEYDNKCAALTEHDARIAAATETHAKLINELESLTSRYQKGEAFEKEQELLILTNTVSFDTLRAVGNYRHLDETTRSSKQRYDQILKEMSNVSGELEKISTNMKQSTSGLSAAYDRLEYAQKSLAEGRKLEKQYYQSTMAAQLAGSLEYAKPCPVCGSIHHPSPAEPAEEFTISLDDLQAQLDAAQKDIERIKVEASASQSSNQAYQRRQKDLEMQMIMARAEYERHEQALQDACTEFGTDDFVKLEADLKAKSIACEEAQKNFEKARIRLTELRKAAEVANMKVQQAAMDVQKLESMRASHTEVIASLYEKLIAQEIRIEKNEKALPIATKRFEKIVFEIQHLQQNRLKSQAAKDESQKRAATARQAASAAQALFTRADESIAELATVLETALKESGFSSEEQVEAAKLSPDELLALEETVKKVSDDMTSTEARLMALKEALNGKSITQATYEQTKATYDELTELSKKADQMIGKLTAELLANQAKFARLIELNAELIVATKNYDKAVSIRQLLRGNALVEFIAQEYLHGIVAEATTKLSRFSAGRYQLALDEQGQFIVRDLFAGSLDRPTSSLSGGETFLVSLALALSLSLHINLNSQPLGFFFLDEGFGTLDAELLNVVMNALDSLKQQNFAIGIISHVPQLKERITTRLIVDRDDDGSHSHIELG